MCFRIQESLARTKKSRLDPSAHKQERAFVTRRDLIRAARATFARDGFEATRIEDIAAKAGKTRGAFYANFKDKEDVFFAIFEEDKARDQEKIGALFSAASNRKQKVEALVTYLDNVVRDRQRVLLNLGFKMYVIRHPNRGKRLRKLHSEMCERAAMTKINTLFPELVGANLQRCRSAATEVGAIMDGIALNVLFNPHGLTSNQRERYLRFAALVTVQATQKPDNPKSKQPQIQPTPP
jgi:AcrR family transcriptional regulator